MIDLTRIEDVKALQSNLRASLGTPAGKEVIKFLEEICGWYDFSEMNPDVILIKHGKRAVLSTLKTLLEQHADTVVEVARMNNETS